MAKIFMVTPFPHWVEMNDDNKPPTGCLIVFILFLIGMYFLTA